MDPISSSILGPVCRRVSAAALEEYALVSGVKEEIEKLKLTVGAIEGVLQDAERKRAENDGVSVWLQSLKQILFDAEDVLDEIAVDEEAFRRTDADGTRRWPIVISMIAKVCNIICSLLSGDILHSRGIAHRIQDIRKRFDFISGEKDKLGLHHMLMGGISSSSEVRTNRRLETSFPLDNIIARDAEKKEIERLLLLESAVGSDNNNLHVIVVDGMGGMGKTTLVKHVYNNPVVRQHFEPKMWVCVSNDFDVERITKKIMQAVCTLDELKAVNEIENFDVAQKYLKDKLEMKRFLLVLDDVWEKDSLNWQRLCTPFMCGGKGCKIVVTTRSQEVAHKGTRISLRGLSSEDLRAIFERHAFDNCDPGKRKQLEGVGSEIVENLKGLPLAAKIIGRLLNRKLDLDYWRSVLKEKTWQLSQPGEDNILDVLKLSYDYLPGHLKQCFAYCSLFPEDYRFDKDELVQLWMAQQFIEHRVEGNTGGDECFDSLVHASLLEPYMYEPYMDEDKYVMHDLIQNLTEKVSKGDCFRLEGSGNFKGNSKTVRHVSIATNSFDGTKFSELCKFKNTRTLLFLSGLDSQLDRHYLDDLFTKLQRLRVLGLGSCKIEELPTSIGTLKHLRYLDLSCNDMSKLPESLCKLLNLQVLKLKFAWMKELPTSIGTLKHLRFLDLFYSYRISELPESLCELPNLQVLKLKGVEIKELPTSIGSLRHLQFLDLSSTSISKLPESLCELLNLQVLKLHHAEIQELPTPIGSLRHLQFLDLSETSISKLPESLCELLNLQVLKLHSAKIKELPTSIGTLKDLQFLDLSSTPIRELPESLCELHNLQVLDLRGCDDLGALPENMSALINLRHLYVDCYNGHNELLVSSIRGLGKLTALQELDFDCRGQKMGEVLAGMDMLRQLNISHLEEVKSGEEASESKLDMKVYLEELEMSWSSTEADSTSSIDHEEVLRIQEEVKSKEEASESRLDMKVYLEELEMSWSSTTYADSRSSCDHEEVLRSLEPPSSSLRRLTIVNYGGIRSPGWMDDQSWLSSSSSLESLELRDCTNWEVLPPLGQLPCLRILDIRGMGNVRRIGPRFMGGCGDYAEDGGGVLVGVPGGGGGFPLLKELEFTDMEEWEEWDAPPLQQQQQQQQQQQPLPHPQQQQIITYLPCLRKLVIHGCPKLRQLPPLPPTLTELMISEVGLTHLPGCWVLPPSSSSTLMSSPSSSPALSSLVIDECPNLTSLTDGLLPRLGSLEISSSSVRQMKAWLLQCPPSSLQELTIKDCPQLTGFDGTGDENDDDDVDDDGGDDDDVDSGSGGSASLLEAALLERLAPTLRSLVFWLCENLRSLPPNFLRCLSSLESLEVYYCPQIRSLPVGGLPESLRSLSINGCPALEERCRREEGADWHLISHIDHLRIG